MYRYVAYGLRLASDLGLPELVSDPDPSPPDATLALGPVRALARGPVRPGCFEAGPGYAFLALDGAAVARVSGGTDVALEVDAGADPALVRAFVLGAVLALALGQRGRLVLHASAVALRGAGGPADGRVGAVAFVGEKGWGKSTTAAALVGRGHALLTDDLAVLDAPAAGPPRLQAGFAQMRLWPDALGALGEPAAGLPRVFDATDKRRWDAGTFAAGASAPLRAVYVLADGAQVEVEPLGLRDAAVELLQHSFLRHLLLPAGLAPAHLAQVGTVLREVPVCRLRRPRALAGLSSLAAAVEAHAAGLAAPGRAAPAAP